LLGPELILGNSPSIACRLHQSPVFIPSNVGQPAQVCPPKLSHRTQIGNLPLKLRHESCLSIQWWFWHFSRKHCIVAPSPIRR